MNLDMRQELFVTFRMKLYGDPLNLKWCSKCFKWTPKNPELSRIC